MDESFEKGMKLLSVNGGDASIPKIREIGRILVMGYDTGLPHDDVERALRKHFSSCGEITDVYLPMDYRRNTLKRCAYIYFVGEGAVDKAFQLNGSDVGGWIVSTHAHPFQPLAKYMVSVTVDGYDTSLSEIDIKSALRDLFSSCGKVDEVIVNEGSAQLELFGKDALEKAPKLSGSLMGGHKLVVRSISLPVMPSVHRRRPTGGFICGRHPRNKKKAKLTC